MLKIVKENLNEFERHIDPKEVLKIGRFKHPPEIDTGSEIIYMDWPTMTGSIDFELDGWDSKGDAKHDIKSWANGANDMIGEDIDIALEEYGYQIIYGKENMDIQKDNYIWTVHFKIEPI